MGVAGRAHRFRFLGLVVVGDRRQTPGVPNGAPDNGVKASVALKSPTVGLGSPVNLIGCQPLKCMRSRRPPQNVKAEIDRVLWANLWVEPCFGSRHHRRRAAAPAPARPSRDRREGEQGAALRATGAVVCNCGQNSTPRLKFDARKALPTNNLVSRGSGHITGRQGMNERRIARLIGLALR
jgi:hypothetical protein